jgi:hypothetical protein
MSFWFQWPDLEFDEESHQYFWKGVPIRYSVSAVPGHIAIKKYRDDGTSYWSSLGFDDAWNNPAAKIFGTSFHKACSIILHGGEPVYPDVMEPWIKQFRLMVDDWNIVPITDAAGAKVIEYPMYSTRYKIAGTADCIAYSGKNKAITVFDWKSSTSSQDYWRGQTAAYATIAAEVLKIKSKIVCVPVRFDEAGFYPDVRDRCPQDWNWFLSCLNILRKD